MKSRIKLQKRGKMEENLDDDEKDEFLDDVEDLDLDP